MAVTVSVGPFALVLQSLPESFGFRFGEKNELRRNFCFQNGNAVAVCARRKEAEEQEREAVEDLNGGNRPPSGWEGAV